MKKYILSVIILAGLFACNENKTSPEELPLPAADSSPAKNESSPEKIDTGKTLNTNVSLTPEELKDDTIFSDGSKPTDWQNAGITDVKAFKLFLKKVQLFVMDNDKEQLAKLVKYPLNKSIKTEKNFIDNYDQVFSKDAKLSIAKINFSQIFRNYQGVMTEEGKVWFAPVGKEFKIIAINNQSEK